MNKSRVNWLWSYFHRFFSITRASLSWGTVITTCSAWTKTVHLDRRDVAVPLRDSAMCIAFGSTNGAFQTVWHKMCNIWRCVTKEWPAWEKEPTWPLKRSYLE